MSFQTFNPLVVYPANGETTVFPIPDKFYDAGDIKVFSIVGGLEESIIDGFSVQITATDPIPPKMNSGNVVFDVAPAIGDIALLIWPNSDQDQPFEGRPVTPKQRERVHDRHAMRDAVLRQFFFRGYRSPLNADPGLRFIAAGEPGRVPTWDELGNLVEGPTVAEVSQVANIAAQIVIVSGISAQIQALALIDTEIVGVYSVRAEIAGLYPIRAAIATLAPLDDEIALLATVADEIAALGPVAAQIGMLGPIATQISAVAAIDAEILAVYAKLSDIEAVAAELPDIASKLNADGSNATARTKWRMVPIGQIIYVDTSLAGSEIPPADAGFIELTAGLDGAGEYNEGKLTSEMISGSGATLVATATVNDIDQGPMHLSTINLINTEERTRYAGERSKSGNVFNDQIERIQGDLTIRHDALIEADMSSPNVFSVNSYSPEAGRVGTGANAARRRASFDSANVVRSGDRTRAKGQFLVAFLKYKDVA